MTAPDLEGVLAAHVRQGVACTCMAWTATVHSNREWTFDPASEHRAHVAAQLRAEMVAWLGSQPDIIARYRRHAVETLAALAEQVGPS